MKKIISLILFCIIIFFIFHSFFPVREIIGGDFPYFYQEQLQEFSFFPALWIANQRLGTPIISPWIDTYVHVIIFIFVRILHVPWNVIQTIFFFLFAIFLSIISSFYLYKELSNKGSLLSSLIYTCNTYFLLIFGGGQAGVFLAYAITPLVLTGFIKIGNALKENKTQNSKLLQLSIIAGLFFAVQVLFDIRIAYVTVVAVGLYVLLFLLPRMNKKKQISNILFLIFYTFIIPFGIAILFHAFWLLSLLLYKQSPLDTLSSAYSSQETVKFFSFATFSQAFSLLHPNWPENIFGKIYFMRPEFLLMPILAYSSLLFVKNSKLNSSKIIFFALLGLAGTFLAKGANEPFGQVYIWLFKHVPGFIMFRDPTKWYVLVALAYSILISFTLLTIFEHVRKFSIKSKIFNIQNVLLLFLISYFFYLIHPALQGKLTGTFQQKSVPHEYKQLKNFLLSEQKFSRTLWIPQYQRFGFYTQQHPEISADQLFNISTTAGIIKKLQASSTEKLLQESAIQYVIVPYDSEGEIFLDDRKYSEKKYKEILFRIKKIPWLTQVKQFGKIIVFQVKHPKEHFWIEGSSQKSFINIISASPTKYVLKIIHGQPGQKIIFSETYNQYWKAAIVHERAQIISQAYHQRFNSFLLTQKGNYILEISYIPQNMVVAGQILQIVTGFFLVGFWTIFTRKNSRTKEKMLQ